MNKHLSQDDAHVAAKDTRCSPPPAIREVPIKTTVRYLFAPPRPAVLKNNKIKPADQYWQRSGQTAALTTAAGDAKWFGLCRREVGGS